MLNTAQTGKLGFTLKAQCRLNVEVIDAQTRLEFRCTGSKKALTEQLASSQSWLLFSWVNYSLLWTVGLVALLAHVKQMR